MDCKIWGKDPSQRQGSKRQGYGHLRALLVARPGNNWLGTCIGHGIIEARYPGTPASPAARIDFCIATVDQGARNNDITKVHKSRSLP